MKDIECEVIIRSGWSCNDGKHFKVTSNRLEKTSVR